MGQVHTLVNHYPKRLIRTIEQLEGPDPEDNLFHQVHLAERAIEKRLEFIVQSFLARADSTHEGFEVFDVHPCHVLHGAELGEDFTRILPRDLPLVNGLERPAASPASGFE